MEVQVNYKGVELILTGNYQEQEIQVNFSSCFNLETAETIKGFDISILLSNEQIEDLENLATEQIER
jgi:hypothetical protein